MATRNQAFNATACDRMDLSLRFLIGFMLITMLYGSTYKLASAQTINLLPKHPSNAMAGSTVDDNGRWVITGMGRMIRPKTTGKWYFNPPIHLEGPKLITPGDFAMVATLDVSTHPNQDAYLDFYGSIPIPHDEWRIDGRSVRVGIRDREVCVWVNMEKQPFQSKVTSDTLTFSLVRNGNRLVFLLNDEAFGDVRDSVFENGYVMFGADASPGSQFMMTEFTAKGDGLVVIDNGKAMLKQYQTVTPSLRSAAGNLKPQFWIGSAVQANALLSDADYARTLATEFSMITPEMDMKWQAIHPAESIYAWAEADAIVQFAELNAIRVHGHTLVWHEAVPEWVWDMYRRGDRERLHNLLMDHITAVVSRYKGRIPEWDVLNEIFSDEQSKENPFGLRDDGDDENNPSLWFKAFGPQIYIDAIKKVKEIDPNCEVWINEYGIEQIGMRYKLENLADFILYARSQGAVIDGVGFQAHNYDPEGDPSTRSDVIDSFEFITRKTGVMVRIAELDVDGASQRPTLFADKLEACLTVNKTGKSRCRSLGMWGFTDKYGSMSGPKNEGSEGDNYTSPNWGAWYGDALLLDENMAKKQAYYDMFKVMQP